MAVAARPWHGSGVSKSPERIGQVIAQRYELVDVVGRGGQGVVYRAHDRWSSRDVAVKVLSSKAAREPQMVQRLMREQQALVVLKGTAAVELFDVCRGNDGELCLVMEFLKGTDLDDHLYTLEQRNERMNLLRVVSIFDPIVSTLEAAHANGILHRDLKPANIFLLEGGGVRLLDFGMARLKGAVPLTAAGTVMGSPSFMAPEAWKGMSDLLDARADVYSLGVILFLVLSGQLPFAGESLQEKFLGATTGKRRSLRELRPQLPRDADAWVASALALDREQRFGSVRALWNAFQVTFDVGPKRESLWAKAKGAVNKIAGTSQPAPRPEAPIPDVHVPGSDEPSFAREALARAPFHVALPTPTPVEHTLPLAPAKHVAKTMDIEDDEIEAVEPPPRRPPPPPRAVEKTLSISAELVVEPEGDRIAPKSEPKRQ
jgi:eukaryotic-like serine/threonine-protein kinase